MADYANSDAKTILSDVQIEIAATANQVELLTEKIKQMNDDIEAMSRAMDNFVSSLKKTREAIISDVAEVSTKAFSDQISRLESVINNQNSKKSKKKSRRLFKFL